MLPVPRIMRFPHNPSLQTTPPQDEEGCGLRVGGRARGDHRCVCRSDGSADTDCLNGLGLNFAQSPRGCLDVYLAGGPDVLRADLLEQFFAVYGYRPRRLYAEPNLIATDLDDEDLDVIVDNYGLSDFPCQN
jgi:hypothetical protein